MYTPRPESCETIAAAGARVQADTAPIAIAKFALPSLGVIAVELGSPRLPTVAITEVMT